MQVGMSNLVHAEHAIAAGCNNQVIVGLENHLRNRLLQTSYAALVIRLMFKPDPMASNSFIERLYQRHKAEHVGGVGRKIRLPHSKCELWGISQEDRERNILRQITGCIGLLLF